MNGRPILWLPLIGFILLSSALLYGLARPADRTVVSQVTGARVPTFSAAAAVPGKPGLTSADLSSGRPHLVNVFASWCVPCAAEAPQLAQIAAAGVPVVGIAVHDRPDAIAAFLRRHGDPFRRIGLDPNSQVQLAFGSAGVPETFLVDGRGMVTRQIVGPIAPDHVPDIIAAARAAP